MFIGIRSWMTKSFAVVLAPVVFIGNGAAAQETNACPVDGCEISISSAKMNGDEIEVMFDANFQPDVSKNHIHIWWGENFTVRQVSANAETVHNVKQGDWHPTADYPNYVTTSAASTSQRNGATTLCVSAADRNHDIIDPDVSACVSVEDLLK